MNASSPAASAADATVSDRTKAIESANGRDASARSLANGDHPIEKTWSVGTLTYTKASLVALFGWLVLGDFAWATRDRSVGPMASWYLRHLGASNFVFALVLSSLPAAISLVLAPIISFQSDRYRSARGRRIPFVRVTTVGAAVGMAGMATSASLGDWIARLAVAHGPGAATLGIGLFALAWVIYEFSTIAAACVFQGLLNDVVPHDLAGRFFGLFRIVSLTDGIVFNFYLVGKVEKYFVLMMLSITAVYVVFMLLMCWRVREGQYPPPPVLNVNSTAPTAIAFAALRSYVRDCFRSGFFLLVFLFGSVAGLAYNPISAFAIPQSQQLHVTMDQLGRLYVIMFIGSFLSAFPSGGWRTGFIRFAS